MSGVDPSWANVLIDGTAMTIGAVFVLVSVVVGARIYRAGVKDRPVDPSHPVVDDDDDPSSPGSSTM